MKFHCTVEGRDRLIEISDGKVLVDGESFPADVQEIGPGIYSILAGGQRSYEARVQPNSRGTLDVYLNGQHFAVQPKDPRRWRRSGTIEVEGRQDVVAPMPGKVIRILVEAGRQVEAGQGVAVVEAMKMQNEIKAPKTGQVLDVSVAAGDAVISGQVLLTII